jgi:hypothetical protein
LTGATGTSHNVPRSDHSHPVNIDNVAPESVGADIPGDPGASNVYADRAHLHPVVLEADVTKLTADGPTSAAGSLGTVGVLPRSDHRHPLNVDATLPLPVNLAAAAGTSAKYARIDHVHTLSALVIPKNVIFYGAAFNSGVVEQLVAGVGDKDLSGCVITVPAGTFSTGIIAFASVETVVYNECAVQAQLKMSQAGGATKQWSGAGSAYTTYPIVPGVADNLGSIPLYMATSTVAGEDTDNHTQMAYAVWAKAGTTDISGMGTNLDWNPALPTVIDFTRMYYNVSDGQVRMAKRNIIVLGF